MGQFLSHVGVGLWPHSQALTHPSELPSPPPAPTSNRSSPLLHLPADVLLLLSDYLDPPAALSLSLTCRSTYALCFTHRQRKLRPDDRREFLQLLERDPLGRGVYYCYPCNKLHSFKQGWGPHSKEEGSLEGTHHCANRDRFSPIGNPYELAYPHARLVMNRYLYGPQHGISLQNLNTEQIVPHGAADIHCSTMASIINSELFVRRSYTFTLNTSSIANFRKCTGARDFRLCEHTSFFSNSSVYRQYIPELQRQPWANAGGVGGDSFVPCTEAPGSCGLCLLDYDITIAPADQDRWAISIAAYHQLGECRSPEDWKWARFTEACRPHLFFPNRPNRRGSTHYPGVVKKRWLDGTVVHPSEGSLRVASKASMQFTFPFSWLWLWRELKRPLSFGSVQAVKVV